MARTTPKIAPNEAVIFVHGLVCSFCAIGVQKKLSKLPFLDKSKYTKGVFVEIEKQKVTIALKKGAKFDIKAITKAIKSGGYAPIKIYIADGNGRITNFNLEKK